MFSERASSQPERAERFLNGSAGALEIYQFRRLLCADMFNLSYLSYISQLRRLETPRQAVFSAFPAYPSTQCPSLPPCSCAFCRPPRYQELSPTLPRLIGWPFVTHFVAQRARRT